MKMKFLAAVGMMSAAFSAHAAPTLSYAAGVSGLQAGDTLIADFDTTNGGVVTTGNAFVTSGSVPGQYAAPGLNNMTNYLAIQSGGSASFAITGLFNKLSFDVGSVDLFNKVTVITLIGSTGTTYSFQGQQLANAANGNQTSSATNGRLSILGGAGETFTGLTLTSTGNSFEVDNIAGSVPEPASWAMMVGGFGMLGGMMRRNRVKVAMV